MEDALHQELSRFEAALAGVSDPEGLYALQVAYLGKKGAITRLRGRMKGLSPAERKTFGQAFNRVKDRAVEQIEARRVELAQEARRVDLARVEDLTALPDLPPSGSLHLVTQTQRTLEAVFERMGFQVMDGPHVEHERTNFDDLNIPPEHPARDMQDTFFVRGRGQADPRLVLRTHTSPVQIRTMLSGPPPVRIVAPGRVFRRDDDATHTPMFHQIEGLYVDRRVSMADLKATLYRFVSAFFGADLEVRFRPSFFPFVEPGAEFDVACPFCARDGASCAVCKATGWIELGGAGMVHPAVFEAVGYDPASWTGWAFGFGIDRMAMLLHGVHDLRLLFEGDRRFSEQFPC